DPLRSVRDAARVMQDPLAGVLAAEDLELGRAVALALVPVLDGAGRDPRIAPGLDDQVDPMVSGGLAALGQRQVTRLLPGDRGSSEAIACALPGCMEPHGPVVDGRRVNSDSRLGLAV